MSTPSLDEWKNWSPSVHEQVLARAKDTSVTKAWFCQRGRMCDGKPHEGAEHPHARGAQWPPAGDWFTWAVMGGRGTGKTRTGAEMVRRISNSVMRMAIIGPTTGDVRDTMIEGESGLQAVCERARISLNWEPSKRKATFANGAEVHTYSAEEPDRLRGPQHGFAWLDEPAHMDAIETVWDNLLLGLRLGRSPRIVLTTTPTPIPWVRERVNDELTVVTRESTYANLDNLAPQFARVVLKRYEGTRLGRQELHGEILEDVEGALWTQALIESAGGATLLAEYDEIVVGVDPAGTSTRRSDETGIVVVARAGDHLYVLADYSGTFSPKTWADKAATAYSVHDARFVVAEDNYGGEMVKSTLNNANHFMNVKRVNSRRSKMIRAEPVVALYEQGRIHHVAGLDVLEDQLLSWIPNKGSSPDRLDALVHAVHALVRTERPASLSSPAGRIAPIRRSLRSPSRQLPAALRSAI